MNTPKHNCFIVDPIAMTITEATVDFQGEKLLSQCYDMLECNLIEFASTELYCSRTQQFLHCHVIVDEEGALVEENPTFSIGRGEHRRHLAGRAIVAGDSATGGIEACPLSLDDLAAQIRFHGTDAPINAGFFFIAGRA